MLAQHVISLLLLLGNEFRNVTNIWHGACLKMPALWICVLNGCFLETRQTDRHFILKILLSVSAACQIFFLFSTFITDLASVLTWYLNVNLECRLQVAYFYFPLQARLKLLNFQALIIYIASTVTCMDWIGL